MPLLKAFGKLMMNPVKIPNFEDVDVAKEQKAAVQGNIDNFKLIEDLTQKSTELGLKQIDTILGSGTNNQIQANIKAGLGGELPKDVVDFVRRNAAETAQSGGFGGSGMARNLGLRDLGITSLQRTEQTLDSASRWLANPSLNQFNFSGMFLTPGQAIAQKNTNVERRFQRDFVQNQIDSAFDSKNIWGTALGDMDDTIVELVSAYLGAMGGGAAMGGG